MARSSKASMTAISAYFLRDGKMCPISMLYKTWISACSCCEVAVFKRKWR